MKNSMTALLPWTLTTAAVLLTNPNTMFFCHALTSPAFRTRSFSRHLRTITSKTEPTALHSTPTSEQEWSSTDKIRSTFVSYFSEKNHTMHPSSPCIPPPNDPTLLFTNAGMNQFKPIFLNQIPPNTPLATLSRATNSQKCIRAGGKHNDLEDVGADTYHHTFFEMLGSWSFGDYFKTKSVDMAWDLLVNVYGLDPERIYATYFEGDEGCGKDDEARDLWLRYLPEERVIASNREDNFWEMGETGPCGPCTEIHYDRIGDRDASHLVNKDDPNVIEIWNLVFIQYNRLSPTELTSLPQKHIDTGMGLERLVSILQNVESNYDIDSFRGILVEIEKLGNARKYDGRVGEEDGDNVDTAYRVVADHIRTLCFAIADGGVPSNEGRGYVLRRILRRGARYGKQILGCDDGFFEKLVPVVISTYAETYPELKINQALISSTIREEEQSFSSMLGRGIQYFETLLEENPPDTKISGTDAFYLYDTLGFPVDLTDLMAQEAGTAVDMEGFECEMENQKERSREARRVAKAAELGGEVVLLGTDDVAELENGGVTVTEDVMKYEEGEVEATVKALVVASDGIVSEVSLGGMVGVVLDTTSFYAESGGQDGDTGVLLLKDDAGVEVAQLQVFDTQIYGGYILHVGSLTPSSSSSATTISTSTALKATCQVDYTRRKEIIPNHTTTHILNAALRQILGDTVEQKGSLVNSKKLRFDFSHKKALKVKQLLQIEQIVNDKIELQLPVLDTVMPLQEAKEIDGVSAVFGEVYPDPVRVVRVGEDISVEFCGGTHIKNTREAEAFVLVEETAVAKGVRRITGITGALAISAMARGKEMEGLIAFAEGNPPGDDLEKTAVDLRKQLEDCVISAPLKSNLRDRIEGMQKAAAAAKKAGMQKRVDVSVRDLEETMLSLSSEGGRPTCLVAQLDIGTDSKASQKILKVVKKWEDGEVPFFGLSEEEPGTGNKIMAFTYVPERLQGSLKANDWVNEVLAKVDGRGGGKAGNAQGQAKECDDVGALLEYAKEVAAGKLEGAGAEVV